MASLGVEKSESDDVKSFNVVFDHEKGKIYLPLKNGADLKNIDPQFFSFFTSEISPKGPQDFSNGPVIYTVKIDGIGEKQYETYASVDNNPVLEGYYADPEIIYSHKENKFFLYPTSDGHDSWSGTYFEVFSS